MLFVKKPKNHVNTFSNTAGKNNGKKIFLSIYTYTFKKLTPLKNRNNSPERFIELFQNFS